MSPRPAAWEPASPGYVRRSQYWSLGFIEAGAGAFRDGCVHALDAGLQSCHTGKLELVNDAV